MIKLVYGWTLNNKVIYVMSVLKSFYLYTFHFSLNTVKTSLIVIDCPATTFQQKVWLLYYYYRYSALGPVWAETRAQSGDWYGSGTLHPGQVLRGSLPLLSPDYYIHNINYLANISCSDLHQCTSTTKFYSLVKRKTTQKHMISHNEKKIAAHLDKTSH